MSLMIGKMKKKSSLKKTNTQAIVKQRNSWKKYSTNYLMSFIEYPKSRIYSSEHKMRMRSVLRLSDTNLHQMLLLFTLLEYETTSFLSRKLKIE